MPSHTPQSQKHKQTNKQLSTLFSHPTSFNKKKESAASLEEETGVCNYRNSPEGCLTRNRRNLNASMRCKEHAAVDPISSVGVCATCLRERLTAIIEAQTRAHAQAQLHTHLSRLHGVVAPEQDPIKQPDPNHPPPPPLVFPRSVSPYVSRRKSSADDSSLPPPSTHHHQHQHHIRIYSTPQVGPTFAVDGGCYRKSKPRYSLLTSLFRSRSDKFWAGPSRVDPIHQEPSPSSWISAIFAGKRGRRKTKQCFVEESATVVQVRSRHIRARGMSPDFSLDDCDLSASGSGDSTTPEWKRTQVQATPSRKNRSGPAVMKNVSGLTFCLSPLVRANPNQQWNPKVMQGGFSTELGESTGEIRPHLSYAASFSMNRSRKLADFGRATSNR